MDPETPAPEPEAIAAPAEFSWQASEFIHHQKRAGWFLGLVLLGAILVAVAVITKQYLSAAVFGVMAVTLVMYGRKTPRTLDYALDESGITIGGKFYPYSLFRSFSLLQDVGWHAVDLEPVRRLMPRLTILLDDAHVNQVVAILANYLPTVDRHPDWIERLTRYLKF